MFKKNIKSIIFYAIVISGVFTLASAQNPFDINYPIAELGGCGSQEECKNFCDNPENHLACIDWGKKQGAFSAVEAKKMKDIEQMENRPNDPTEGPGGCTSPKTCDAYCRILENLDECLDFSVKHGYTSTEEAKKIKEQADRGGPNGCKSKEECDSFCKNPENMETCMKFVVEEGKITQEEADLMITMSKNKDFGKPKGPKIDEEKAMKVLEEVGGGPGGCKNPQECKNYCEDMTHGEECIKFAMDHGFMPPEEAQRAQKMMTMGGPGGCRGPQECDAFCSKEENRDTCFNFSKESGMLSSEEIIMMERQMSIINKMGPQAGPGGCRSMSECSNYCSDPAKVQECMDFASKTGMMSKERAQTMIQQVEQAGKMQEFFMMEGEPPIMRPPEGFTPPNEFPPEGFKPPEGMPLENYPMPPEGFIPPEGYQQRPPEGFKPPEGFVPPTGMTPPADFNFTPPSDYQRPPDNFVPPSDGTYSPPPAGEFTPPPSGEIQSPPPTSMKNTSLLGAVLGPFLKIFGF